MDSNGFNKPMYVYLILKAFRETIIKASQVKPWLKSRPTPRPDLITLATI